MFSKACEYAIRAMVLIAAESKRGRSISLGEIAGKIDSPPSFTSKVLQELVRANLLDSAKGAHGGVHLSASRLANITLKDIVFCIDGDTLYQGCGLGLKQCSEKDPCPMHDSFKKLRDDLSSMLDKTTLVQLADRLDSGQGILKRA